jgi:dolichol-phosphate mannosyltransferase
MRKKVSIIIPAFNEEKFLPKLINKIKLSKISNVFEKEIIIVDDGSTDDTKKVVKNFKNIKYFFQKNSGKGKAVQRGIKSSTGQIILVQDADLEYDPVDYNKLLHNFKKRKKIAVFGSRYLKKNFFSSFQKRKKNHGFFQILFNFILSTFFYILYGKYITDLLTGYKLYERDFFKKISVKTRGFETDHELTIKLLKKGYKIIEVPIKYYPRSKQEGKKINIIDAFKAIITILKLKFL